MFDIGFFELLFIAIVALLVLGPEKMPHAVRMAGAWIGKIRRSFLAAKYEVERHIELEEFKQRVESQKSKLEDSVTELNHQLNQASLPIPSHSPADSQSSIQNTEHNHTPGLDNELIGQQENQESLKKGAP